MPTKSQLERQLAAANEKVHDLIEDNGNIRHDLVVQESEIAELRQKLADMTMKYESALYNAGLAQVTSDHWQKLFQDAGGHLLALKVSTALWEFPDVSFMPDPKEVDDRSKDLRKAIEIGS